MYLIECFHFGRITNQATATKSFSSTSFSKSRSFTSSITAWQCFAFVCLIVQKCQKIKEQSSSSKSSFLTLALSLKSTSLSVSIYLRLSQRERIEYPDQLKQHHCDKSQIFHHRHILKLKAEDYRS